MATVILDAGHGGKDGGAVYDNRLEKDDNLNMVLAVGTALEGMGVDVLYTRTTDIYQSPSEKANIANRSDADYFVSIHRNSSPTPNTYSGIETLVYKNAGIPSVMAGNINMELAEAGFTNLGIKERPGLAVLRGTRMPAVLVEVGFINTKVDNDLFAMDFENIAEAIAKGIRNTVTGAELSASHMEIYQVELGEFRHMENARELARCLQEDGFDCRILSVDNIYQVIHGPFETMEQAKEMETILFRAGYETRIVCSGDK